MLEAQEADALRELSRARAGEARLVERSKLILLAADGLIDRQIAAALGLSQKTVYRWRHTYTRRRAQDPQSTVRQRLADAPRVGRPDRFDELFWVDVLAIATAAPESYARPITQWTARELTEVILEQKLTDDIHSSTVARFLRDCRLQPHRVREWMNRKQDPEFDSRATDVKQCLVDATSGPPPANVITVSFDEKTGMQAKERIAPPQPMRPDQPERLEFEYARHGTLVLFAMMVVDSGRIVGATACNRTNPVTATVLGAWLARLLAEGYEHIHVLLDQLNTHWSQDLVNAIAQLCGLHPVAVEEMATGRQRRAWLSAPDNPITFHFTPKHASWLNPVEIWFGVLVRKVLRRGSFTSTQDLATRIDRFIAYYNDHLAHPYRFKLHRKRAA
jgi:transposase